MISPAVETGDLRGEAGLSFRGVTRAVLACAAGLLLFGAATGCGNMRGVAHSDWNMGVGPVAIDLERPIIVATREEKDSVDVLFPILFYSEATGRYFRSLQHQDRQAGTRGRGYAATHRCGFRARHGGCRNLGFAPRHSDYDQAGYGPDAEVA